ncbi:HlyD family secretion protein [Parasynechococcus sp.]|uniref:HlyD family secretion protein n=1 Tax=Parasynechococcus sp. TaxID=3101203 RepID=UPI00370416A4
MKLNPLKKLWAAVSPAAEQESSALVKYDESVLQQGRFWMRTVTWTLIGTTVFGVAWLALARTEEIVVASGKLEPIGSVKDIQMPVGGVAEEILVKEGQRVSAGDVLMRLDTEASEEQRKSLEKTMALTQQQLQLKEKEKQSYLLMNQEEVVMLEKNLVLAETMLEAYEELVEQGASPMLQLLQQRNDVEETRGRLLQQRQDRYRQESLLDQQMADLRAQLADLRGRLAENRVTLRYQTLTSPVDGVVFDLKPTSSGYTAQSTETVMKVVPLGTFEAKVEVPSNKIGFVTVPQGCPEEPERCMVADISIDSFPATDFGVIQGRVTKISSDALPPDQMEQREQLSFPVTIALDSQQLSLRSGEKLNLQVGMSLTANIKLRKVSYLQLLLGEFQDRAESLQRI